MEEKTIIIGEKSKAVLAIIKHLISRYEDPGFHVKYPHLCEKNQDRTLHDFIKNNPQQMMSMAEWINKGVEAGISLDDLVTMGQNIIRMDEAIADRQFDFRRLVKMVAPLLPYTSDCKLVKVEEIDEEEATKIMYKVSEQFSFFNQLNK